MGVDETGTQGESLRVDELSCIDRRRRVTNVDDTAGRYTNRDLSRLGSNAVVDGRAVDPAIDAVHRGPTSQRCWVSQRSAMTSTTFEASWAHP